LPNQTVQVPIYLGIFFETNLLKEQAINTANQIQNVKLFPFPNKDPQFIRFRKLLHGIKKSKDLSSIKVFFTDDDDLWSPVRTECCRTAAKRITVDHSHIVIGTHFSYSRDQAERLGQYEQWDEKVNEVPKISSTDQDAQN